MLTLVILLTTCSINIALALLVISKKNKGTDISASHTFLLSILSLVAWSVCNYLADTSDTTDAALFWTKTTFPAALCMGWSIVYLSYIFPIKRKGSRIANSVYAVVAFIFSYIAMGSWVVVEVTRVEGVGISDVVVGPLYNLVTLIYLIQISHSTFNFISNYKNLTGKPKSQVKYVLIGWTTFLSIAFITSNLLPLITGNANWSKFGPMGSIVMSLSISYAIVRYQFLDIKIIIQRGLIYSALLSVVATTYLGLVFLSEYIFNESTASSVLVSAFITTVIGIFGTPPLKLYFQKITDPIFFKDRYDYASVLATLAEILNKNISPDTIIEKTSSVLQHSLKAETVTFSLNQDEEDIFIDSNVLSIPIISNRKKVGTLTLGEKRSGDPYTKEDRRLLETFTKQAAIALEKASLYTQVKEYAENLEKKVEERTAEISKIQKEKEALMFEISHGLQTPLTIMKGELFFLRKQGYDTTKVDAIDSSIDRISSFIYRLLNLSRIESTITHQEARFNITALISEIVQFFAVSTKEKGITLVSSLAENVFILGNKDEIDELISNLINNAIKYMKDSENKEITITLSQDSHHNIISVKDTGIGMQKEDVANLFQKFYRIKNDATKGIKGTGLGLAICKKIVEKHNGQIRVSSDYGKGSTFTVLLPLLQ
jgi:signal transduction histidine kinase